MQTLDWGLAMFFMWDGVALWSKKTHGKIGTRKRREQVKVGHLDKMCEGCIRIAVVVSIFCVSCCTIPLHYSSICNECQILSAPGFGSAMWTGLQKTACSNWEIKGTQIILCWFCCSVLFPLVKCCSTYFNSMILFLWVQLNLICLKRHMSAELQKH